MVVKVFNCVYVFYTNTVPKIVTTPDKLAQK